MVLSQVPIYTGNGLTVYLLPSLVIMTLQNDVQEIKKVYSDSFHATKPLHSVPATLHGWDNLLTIVELLAE